MKNNIKLQISVPSQTRYLSLIGKIGENLAKEISLPLVDRETFAHNMNTVLTEALVNTIKHGCKNTAYTDIKICISISANELVIKVYDNGQGFDLKSIPDLTFESNLLEESGRGIYIIRKIMDSVVYRKAKGGNVLVMRKALK